MDVLLLGVKCYTLLLLVRPSHLVLVSCVFAIAKVSRLLTIIQMLNDCIFQTYDTDVWLELLDGD